MTAAGSEPTPHSADLKTPMYWNQLEHHEGGAAADQIWLSHPLVRDEMNRRVSGNPALLPTGWLRSELAAELPLRNAVVIGCGTGGLERDLVLNGAATLVTGIDTAPEALARARELASAAGLADRITYVNADARGYLAERPDHFDAVLFHASLHHFYDPHEILMIARAALRPGGIVYFDEYVGPSRHQWSPFRLALPNLAYRLLPNAVRRPHLVRAPVNHEDPTEAPASHEIVPALRRLFPDRQMRGYGGNLLSVIYPNLHRPPRVRPEVFDKAVQRLIAFERLLLRVPGARSFYVVAIARKSGKPASDRKGANQ